MNSNPRGVQTPPRPTPNRTTPPQTPRPSRPPRVSPFSSVSTGFWVTLIATVLLLASMLVAMTVMLCVADEPSPPVSEPSGGGQTDSKNNDDKDDTPTAVNKTKPAPTSPSRSNYAITASGGVESIDNISSHAAVLVDLSSYRVTAAKNADTRIYPASMTKVMTLLVACEEIAKSSNDIYLEDLLTVTQSQVKYQQDMGASGIMGFTAGEQVSVENMLYLINYNSDTIACLAVAERISGTESAFVALMNQKAKSLGLSNTNFVNVTGLQDPNHYTTCNDMAAIMAAALDNPLAKKIITSYQGRGIQVYSGGQKSRMGTVYAAWYSDKDRFKDNPRLSTVTVMGGKTGYEDIPTACFVTYAEGKSGGKYICVTVGRITDHDTAVSAATSTADTKIIYNTYVS